MEKKIKIGNAQAFWGDRLDAAAMLLAQQPDLDYITLDYLSEVSLSIMAIQKEKNPHAGYAKDFVEVVRSLVPAWKKGSQVKIITNAGGLDPKLCADACKKALEGLSMKIGIAYGDDVLADVKKNPEKSYFTNLDNQASMTSIVKDVVTANAYLGANPIVEALRLGANIVITGRVADPSLTLAPCMAHFHWSLHDYNKIAQATLAGHLIECGTQVTGGISNDWLDLHDVEHIGFPFVEMDSDGSFVITKPKNTGGRVDVNTVREQLLYELGDPDCYISPDVVMSVLGVSLTEEGVDRIRVVGAVGKEATEYFKVSATYRDGFRAEGSLAVVGRNVRQKALRMGESIIHKMQEDGMPPERFLIECLGTGDIIPGLITDKREYRECVMRVAVADAREEVPEFFSRLIAPMVTAGAPGTTGYTTGRAHVRPVFGFWPCLIPKTNVVAKVEIICV